MITLFNYYDLKIHFLIEDDTPLHVYANREDKSCMGVIKFKDGLFESIEIEECAGQEKLEELDVNRMKLLIVNNLDEVIKRWIDFYVFNRPIKPEMITERIEDAHFS
jgi:hypothetical protein